MNISAVHWRRRALSAASFLVKTGYGIIYPVCLILAVFVGLLSVVMPPLAALALFFVGAMVVSWIKPFFTFSCLMLLLPFHVMAKRLLSSQLLLSEEGLLFFSLWKELLLLALILAIVLRKILRGERPILTLYKADVWFGALVTMGAAYTLATPSLSVGLFGFRNYFAAFAILYVVRSLPLSWTNLKRLIIMMLLVGVIVAAFAVIQANFLGFEFLEDYGYANESGELPTVYRTRYRPDYPRAASTLTGPNELGVYMALLILVAVGMVSGSRSWQSQTAYGLCVLALLPGLAFTLSRSALGMLAVGLTAPLATDFLQRLRYLRIRIRIGQLLVIGLIIVLIIFIGYKIGLIDRVLAGVSVLTRVLSSPGAADLPGAPEDPSAEGRLADWAYSAGFLMRYPFGIGIGMAGPRAASRYGTSLWIQHTESTYFQLAMELGLIGLLLYLGFWRQIVAMGQQARRRLQSRTLRPFADAALGVMLGILAAYMFIPLAQNFVFSCYLWFVVGVAFRIPDL